MTINNKKAVVLIIAGILFNFIGGIILSYIFGLIRLGVIGHFLSLIISITLIILGVLQFLKKFNIDNYLNLEKYFGSENSENEITNDQVTKEYKITTNINYINPDEIMNYKVVPFPKSKNIDQALQSIIDNESSQGWEYANHKYEHYLMPGTNGCFGLGAKPDTIWHVGHVVFKKA